jgi:hypothetical protein
MTDQLSIPAVPVSVVPSGPAMFGWDRPRTEAERRERLRQASQGWPARYRGIFLSPTGAAHPIVTFLLLIVAMTLGALATLTVPSLPHLSGRWTSDVTVLAFLTVSLAVFWVPIGTAVALRDTQERLELALPVSHDPRWPEAQCQRWARHPQAALYLQQLQASDVPRLLNGDVERLVRLSGEPLSAL